MSSVLDDGLQLSDIMAAFNIPDAGDLPHQCPPPAPPSTENLVPATPTLSVQAPPAFENQIPNMDAKASTLLASIASMASSASLEKQSSGRLGTDIKHGPHFGYPISSEALCQPSHGQNPDIKLNTCVGFPSSSSSSSQSYGEDASRTCTFNYKKSTIFGGPESSMVYGMKTSMEFRYQHEAAVEFDQLHEHAQPVLVYSKEDWPSPDPNGQTNSDLDTANTAPQHPDSPEMTPSSSKGVYYAPTTGVSDGDRRKRSGRLRALPRKAKRHIRERNNQQTTKRSSRVRGKKHDEPTLQSDSLKPFHSVMTPEHRSLISKGLSDSEMIGLLAELQELLRAKHRDSKRLRRARLTQEQLEEERRRNRERKRRSRQDPFIEFRHIMTDEQRKLLLQPDLDHTRRDTIMTELIAVKKWINREQKRARRARLTEEERAEERRKSREYKRRVRSNPLQAFKSVITERHLELLNQDLDQEQRENLVQELIELRKAKQGEDMRKRRANFSFKQREQERSYQGVEHKTGRLYEWGPNAVGNTNTVMNERTQLMPQPKHLVEDSTAHVTDKAISGEASIHPEGNSACVNEQTNPKTYPKLNIKLEEQPVSCKSVNMATESLDLFQEDTTLSKVELEKHKNKIRQRRRRAMQTEEEREEERRKNRERTRMRRKRLAEIEKVVARGRSTLAVETNHQEGIRQNHLTEVNIKIETDSPQLQSTGSPNTPHSSADQTLSASCQSKLLPDQTAPWFTKQLMDEIRKRNRECTQRARANMTEEQRERERARNRERQRLRRFMQSPEERAAYIEKQRNIRRHQRQDPIYREKERERQRLRKKKLRESPWYRAHENTLYYMRKARKMSFPAKYLPLEDNKPEEEVDNDDGDASKQQECGSISSEDLIASDEYDELEKELNNSDCEKGGDGSSDELSVTDESLHEEKEESDSDYEIMHQRSVKGSEYKETRGGLDIEASEDKDDKEDLKFKISTSVFGLHKIVPLNLSK